MSDASSVSFTAAPSSASSAWTDPTELVDDNRATSAPGSNSGGEWSSSGDTTADETLPPETFAPETLAPTPIPTVPAIETETKSASKGPSSAVSISLIITTLVIVLGVIFFVRRRRANKRFISAKFHDQRLGTPTISVELPPAPPSTILADSQVNGYSQRVSVFSNPQLGESMFNTNAPIVSPTLQPLRGNTATTAAAQPFQPAQSTTYRLADPSPSNMTPSSIHQTTAHTPAAPSRRKPDYNNGQPARPPFNKTPSSTSSASFVPLESTFERRTSRTKSQPRPPGRDSAVSMTSTIQGLHDSFSDDLFQYGDGLGRDRAASRTRPRGPPRGPSTVLYEPAQKKTTQQPAAIVKDRAEDIAILERQPAPQPPKSSKTLSINALRAAATGQRRPPPPPPARPPPVPEVEPFNPLLLTSVHVHRQRASEDDNFSALTQSSLFQSSRSINTDRSNTTDSRSSIQRLSDVSSVFSDASTLRAGSLIELQQVVEAPDKGKEIQI